MASRKITEVIEDRRSNKFCVFLECGHYLVCDKTVSRVGDFNPSKRTECWTCDKQGKRELA